MISGEAQEKVAEIVRKMLAERFSGIAFGPIRVVPAVDEFGDGDGEEYLRILVVFDGDQKALDARWTSTLIRGIRPKLFAAGVEEFPSFSFVSKAGGPGVERSLPA
ncbi:MAG: hypothetical protein OXG35_25380 [Acidobacteria bacterium]|nr:hypothetical protein [Acidobacteriota bacterium]